MNVYNSISREKKEKNLDILFTLNIECINKKINPIQLRADKIQTIQDRFKEFEQRKKALKYFKKTNNNNDLSVKTDYIPCNNSYVLEKTPNLKNKINTYRARIRPLEDFFDDWIII